MRLYIPDRIRTQYVLVFAIALALVQQFEGTEIIFSLLCFLYVNLAGLAFNLSGGLLFPSGAYIFFNAMLTCIVGLTYKAFLGQPAQTHLVSPNKTMLIFCLGMAGFALAAFFNSRLRVRHGLISGVLEGIRMKHAAIGCLVLGVLLQFTAETGNAADGTVASAFRQLNHFNETAVLLGGAYAILSTNGKRSTNWMVFIGAISTSVVGLVGFSKEGIFTGPVAWLLTALAFRFRFSKKQIFAILIGAILTNYYLVPYSQYGRRYRDELGNHTSQLLAGLPLLLNLKETRELYIDSIETDELNGGAHFYDQFEGIMDREQMMSVDDTIVTYTDQGNVFGLSPVYSSLLNIVPHFLFPSKPSVNAGNEFGREVGIIGADDVTTGISFSPAGDAYHEASWLGILVVFPLVIFFIFFVTDSLTGSVRDSPLALLPIIVSAHTGPEGMLQGGIYLATYVNLAVIAVVVLSRYVFPPIANIFSGGGRGSTINTRNFQPTFGRRPIRPGPVATTPGPSLESTPADL